MSRFHAYTGDTGYVGEYGRIRRARGQGLGRGRASGGRCQPPTRVIDALATGNVSVVGAGGQYTVDGQTNHTTMDIHIVRGNMSQTFDVIRSFSQRPPLDTQQVCDLHANPDDKTQYEVEVE